MKKYRKYILGILSLLIVLSTFTTGAYASESRILRSSNIQAELAGGDDVFGTGIITGIGDNGTNDLDQLCWDSNTDTNRGYDNSVSNNIIRSFDSITYNVKTTLPNLQGESKILSFVVSIDNDEEIYMNNCNFVTDVPTPEISNGKKVYTLEYQVPDNYSSGAIENSFSIYVGNKKQGYTIKPDIVVYYGDNDGCTVTNVEEVIVTTAPFYNVVLKKKTDVSKTNDIYDFNKASNGDKTYYTINGQEYSNKKVNGYEETYGIALEIKKPGNGIKGVELPDSNSDFSFDVDLSSYTLGDINLIDEGFKPLLYYSGPNENGGSVVPNIPFTNETYAYNDSNKDYHCLNSGDYSLMQEGTTLHVNVKGYQIDINKFPKGNSANESYWENLNAIREGIFSSFQFKVIYPYKNKDGKKLNELNSNNQTVNISAEVKNMNAKSIYNNLTTTETLTTDNKVTDSWPITLPGTKTHSIFYSNRNNWTTEYTPGMKWNDGDVTTSGSKDVAFTVAYEQTNTGEGHDIDSIPVALNQLVLFDRSALTNVTINKYSHSNGYNFTYLYAKYKYGRLTNETMKTASVDDFTYSNQPNGDYDGVLVQYRGCNTNGATLKLYTQFNAEIKDDVKVDSVYMITLVSDIWTVGDFSDKKNEVNSDTNDLTRADWSNWVKRQDKDELVNNRQYQRMDNRNYYTVPKYVEGVYSIDNSHKFSIDSADGLYIIPYRTKVVKKVAQLDKQGNSMQKFAVSKKQRYVDYVLNGSIKFDSEVIVDSNQKTTVYFEDTLPKGLSYLENSSYYGGEYKSQFPNKGVVVNGKNIEPEVINNDDGTTSLKWTINNVSLKNCSLPALHYSCKIGDEIHPDNDVKDNETLKNYVRIYTNEDKRPFIAEHENTASASISILKDKAFYLTKSSKPVLELEDKGYFELLISNTGSQAIDHLCAIDTMPQDGYKNTIMKGQYKLSKVSLDINAIKDYDDLELWYTNNEEYKGKDASFIDYQQVNSNNGWYKANVNVNGDMLEFSGDGLIGSWPTAIAILDEQLVINSNIFIRLEYDAIAYENDHLVNYLTTLYNNNLLPAKAEVDIVKRSLSGNVWEDLNKDGANNKNDINLDNVKVTLLKEEDGIYVPYIGYKEVIKEGNEYKLVNNLNTTLTDKEGNYCFSGLPAGKYQILFESSDFREIYEYDVTKEGNGNNESKVDKNDVKKDNGKLISGIIKNIRMPTLDEMLVNSINNYYLPYLNLGLIKEYSSNKDDEISNKEDKTSNDNIEITTENKEDIIKVLTGDNTNILLFIALMLLSILAYILIKRIGHSR